MIEALITSKTRVKLLLKFFLNSQNTGYLRSLESEFGESTNAIRYELNKFVEAGLLSTTVVNNKKIYQANIQHSLFPEINRIVRKYIGINEIVERIITKVGELEEVYLIGDLANGIDASTVELMFVGQNIDKNYLKKLINKTENIINRKVKYLIFAKTETMPVNPEILSEQALLLYRR